MRRMLFLVFCFLLSAFYLEAQSWQPVGSEINGQLLSFSVFKNELYAGGVFSSPSLYTAEWNGSNWNTGASGYIYHGAQEGIGALLSYDSVLYATGQFDSIGNLPCRSIAQWNGVSWDSVGLGLASEYGNGGNSLLVQNGQLYVGGFYTDTVNGKILNSIGKWDGKNWDTLGKGVLGLISALATYNGKLYAGGQFDVASNEKIQNIAIWDNTKWDSLLIGRPVNSVIYAMVTFKGKLYIAGSFSATVGIHANNIATWDGTKWDSVGGGLNNDVNSLIVYDGMLIAGGSFDSTDGKPTSEIAAWDGTNWHTIGAGLQGGNYGVWGLGVYDSNLYAGGDFTNSGSTSTPYIAMWKGPLGVNEISNKKEMIEVFPNPSTGIFIFKLSGNTGKNVITIYNMFGENIYNTQFNTSATQIDLSGKPAGVYLYRIVSEKGEAISSGKLVIQ
ncbi:MAG TPA: T9SS type A sorting domain-containing protein [Bacteroidia bacterium]|jgi:hypothetical protein|nr:T9SS type A sorting domain-containing protein [Bacteroidia bacterium]